MRDVSGDIRSPCVLKDMTASHLDTLLSNTEASIGKEILTVYKSEYFYSNVMIGTTLKGFRHDLSYRSARRYPLPVRTLFWRSLWLTSGVVSCRCLVVREH